MIRVSLWTAAFLVLLRVCIGWHFFFEGVTKVQSAYQGGSAAEKERRKIEGYFRESEGPFGKIVQKQAGDPDQFVIDRLTPKAVEGDSRLFPPRRASPPLWNLSGTSTSTGSSVNSNWTRTVSRRRRPNSTRRRPPT